MPHEVKERRLIRIGRYEIRYRGFSGPLTDAYLIFKRHPRPTREHTV